MKKKCVRTDLKTYNESDKNLIDLDKIFKTVTGVSEQTFYSYIKLKHDNLKKDLK